MQNGNSSGGGGEELSCEFTRGIIKDQEVSPGLTLRPETRGKFSSVQAQEGSWLHISVVNCV